MKTPSHQRGAAALAVTLLLLFVLTLVLVFANRNLLFEQRSSANQVRSTRAFEAAEAGLEWALAQLNGGSVIGADCAPSTAEGAVSFRERFLAYDAATQRFNPRSWTDAGVAVPLQAACVLGDAGWRCSCPSTGHPTLSAPAAAGTHPAFALRLVAAPRAGMLQLVATGCDHYAPACLPGLAGSAGGGATARLQLTVALLPALATRPAAALTVRGDIAASGALVLANLEPGGLTAQAGGAITLPLATLTTAPGSLAEASIAEHDAELAAAEPERLLARLLGLDRARWRQLPAVRPLDCPSDCTTALAQASGPGTATPMLWIAGDLVLDGPLAFGTAERPLLLVVDGQVRLSGGVQLHGVVVSLAQSLDLGGSADAQLHGALVALGNVGGNGTPTIRYDPAVLARLQGEHGSFARVPGSWRDF